MPCEEAGEGSDGKVIFNGSWARAVPIVAESRRSTRPAKSLMLLCFFVMILDLTNHYSKRIQAIRQTPWCRGMTCISCTADYFTTNTSISTSEPLGSSFTATAERAGKGWAKNSA